MGSFSFDQQLPTFCSRRTAQSSSVSFLLDQVVSLESLLAEALLSRA